MEFNHKYELKLVLAGEKILMEELETDINKCVNAFNVKSLIAKNKKKIVCWSIEEDQILRVVLSSANHLETPTRALHLLSKLLIAELIEKGGESLVDSIISNKSFFRTVSHKEVTSEMENEKTFEILDNPLPNSFSHNKTREIFIALTELLMKPAYTKEEISKISTIRSLLGLDDNNGGKE